MSDVSWMPSALDDLKSARDYIAKDSAHYAQKFVDDAFDATEILETFPKIGREVPEIGLSTVREIGCNSYRIIYELVDNDEKTEVAVNVVAMIHGRRLLPPIEHSNQQNSE